MPEEYEDRHPHQNENVERNDNKEKVNEERFESDADRIVHRHLKNKDDIITDEDIANVRIGATPAQFDEATEARFDEDEVREDAEDELLKGTKGMKEDKNLDEGQITPWDTIDPTK